MSKTQKTNKFFNTKKQSDTLVFIDNFLTLNIITKLFIIVFLNLGENYD